MMYSKHSVLNFRQYFVEEMLSRKCNASLHSNWCLESTRNSVSYLKHQGYRLVCKWVLVEDFPAQINQHLNH